MADLIVNGGKPLTGTIVPSGNKNSVLPILCATLLTDEPVRLRNVPDITDLEKLVAFLRAAGSRDRLGRAAGEMRVDHSAFRSAPRRRRAAARTCARPCSSIPRLLRRMGRITLRSDAKGCSLGVREIDPHLDILRALGAEVHEGDRSRSRCPAASGAAATGSTTCR